MLKRNLQRIQLKLSDLEEYENVRRRHRLKIAVDASSEPVEREPPSIDTTSTETRTTQRILGRDRPGPSGWATAVIPDSNTTSSSTQGTSGTDTSVAAVATDTDTAAELSDDGWIDIDEEDEDQSQD
ncbi:hypothetical protein KR222_009389, partial [Zaprionus bogoriensis]